jgi:hypothetical protein
VSEKGFVEAQLNRLDQKTKSVLTQIFTHVLDTGQIGGVSHQEKARNFKWIRLDSTTATVANEEFTIHHGLGQVPIHVLPFLPLDAVGTRMVRLTVTRAADASRIYLSSPDTSAPFSVLMEV